MDIIFYNNLSDDDTINKQLTEITTLTGNLKNECSVETPTIIISNSGIINANYCFIPEFARYYNVVNQTVISNNRVRIELSVDVLETYKSQILALNAIVDNSSTNNDNYLLDDIWKTKVKTKTDVINFPNGLNNTGSYILITAGG